MKSLSPLQKARYAYQPKLPGVLRNPIDKISLTLGKPTEAISDKEQVKALFPHNYGAPVARFGTAGNTASGKKLNVGVVLSGGQAPGGHNVIAGIFDALKKANGESKLFGFLGGPSGLIDGKLVEITPSMMDEYRNTGGFDMICSGRTKLETDEQYDKSLAVCRKHDITAIIVVGGDDSNTNAAVLAEYFVDKKAGVQVIGCPKTIDGDLKNEYIETSFGFDTATKTYSELIGNIQRDVNSAQKYWHFIKLMGRSASHIGLECALQTQPNIAIISEEVQAQKLSLAQVVDSIVTIVVKRADMGKNFGVALIPEGLIEFIPEVGSLIGELNDTLAHHEAEFSALKGFDDQSGWLLKKLSPASAAVFSSLPRGIREQLLMDRDPHGNVQVSRIDTEKLLMEMVGIKIDELKKAGKTKAKFSPINHFFGYEGRCGFPSNFDADYCYSLGYSAFLLLSQGLTGYISNVSDLHKPADQWIAGGVPLTMMMNMEQRHGKMKPVIKKALVELDGKPFKTFAAARDSWALNDQYLFPGAIQYYGPDEVCNLTTVTLKLEKQG
jgi:pyrophosphate--fructose-6-phosphate 1-phosphotransferase